MTSSESHIPSLGFAFKISHCFQIRIPEFPWSLWIWTSDVKGAGTDAQVFLQIYGERGKSDEIKLENNSDSFEQAQLDKFMVRPRVAPKLSTSLIDRLKDLIDLHCLLSLYVAPKIEMPDVGKLLKLRIWHEKRHPFSGWHLAKVTLLKTLTTEKYSFTCGRWLDVNEDDNEIVRELPAISLLIDEPLPCECVDMWARNAAF